MGRTERNLKATGMLSFRWPALSVEGHANNETGFFLCRITFIKNSHRNSVLLPTRRLSGLLCSPSERLGCHGRALKKDFWHSWGSTSDVKPCSNLFSSSGQQYCWNMHFDHRRVAVSIRGGGCYGGTLGKTAQAKSRHHHWTKDQEIKPPLTSLLVKIARITSGEKFTECPSKEILPNIKEDDRKPTVKYQNQDAEQISGLVLLLVVLLLVVLLQVLLVKNLKLLRHRHELSTTV